MRTFLTKYGASYYLNGLQLLFKPKTEVLYLCFGIVDVGSAVTFSSLG